MVRGLSLFEEALFNFEAQNPNVKWYTRFRIQSSATMSPMPRKRKILHPGPFFSCVWYFISTSKFQEGSYRWMQQGTRTCDTNIRCEQNCCSPSIYNFWYFSSTISHFLSLLQSVTLLACSLNISPWMLAVILYYCTFHCTFQGTVRFKMLYIFFMCYSCEKYYKHITV